MCKPLLACFRVLRLAADSLCHVNCRYLFDEPSSYLDVRQRVLVARLIRSMCAQNK